MLFIIYINDMLSILEKCKVVLYSDDTDVYYSKISSMIWKNRWMA